jgi:hypothetical protein
MKVGRSGMPWQKLTKAGRSPLARNAEQTRDRRDRIAMPAKLLPDAVEMAVTRDVTRPHIDPGAGVRGGLGTIVGAPSLAWE